MRAAVKLILHITLLSSAGYVTVLAANDGEGLDRRDIEEVLVVANKIPRPIHRVAANVSVLSKQIIRDNLSASINDVFQYLPGIGIESAGTRFGAESISIRGIAGNRVASLIDGVPLGDQFDIGNFSNATRDFIGAGLIQKVEILHGPASSLYGSNAIGGVVAMYTPSPKDIMQGLQSGGDVITTYSAADNSSQLQATIAGGTDTLRFLGAASWHDGHEIEPAKSSTRLDESDSQRRSILLKAVADDLNGHSWRFSYLFQSSDKRSDQRSMLETGRFRSTSKLFGDDNSTMELASVEYDLKALTSLFDSSVVRVYHHNSDVEQDTLDERRLSSNPSIIDRQFSYQQETNGIILNLQKELHADQRIGFGLEYLKRSTQEFRNGSALSLDSGVRSNTILGETFPLRDFPLSDTKEFGAYLEYNVFSENWTFIAAARADRYRLAGEVDQIYQDDNPATEVVSLTESELSPKLGAVYHLSSNTDIYLQYAHGFRAPPFEDANIGLDIPIFNIRAIPNPDLRSESSDGVELGFRWRGESTRLHLVFFNTHYDDFIETKVRLGLDPITERILFQSQNLSEAHISGIEADWQLELPHDFNFFGSLYAADGTNKENDQPLNSVGPKQLVLGVGWSSRDGRRALRLYTTVRGKWRNRDETRGDLFKPDGHSVVDAFYTHKLNDKLILRAGLRNVGNREYWHWSDIRGLAPNDPALPVLMRPGRQASLSLNLRW